MRQNGQLPFFLSHTSWHTQTRTRKRTYCGVLFPSSSISHPPLLPPSLRLSLPLRGIDGRRRSRWMCFPCSGIFGRRGGGRRRRAPLLSLAHGSDLAVWCCTRTLTFLFSGEITSWLFFYFHGGGARHLVKKPTGWDLTESAVWVPDLELKRGRLILKWVTPPGLTRSGHPFSGPGGSW